MKIVVSKWRSRARRRGYLAATIIRLRNVKLMKANVRGSHHLLSQRAYSSSASQPTAMNGQKGSDNGDEGKHTFTVLLTMASSSGWSTIIIVSSTSLRMRFMCPSYACQTTIQCDSVTLGIDCSTIRETYVQDSGQLTISPELHEDSFTEGQPYEIKRLLDARRSVHSRKPVVNANGNLDFVQSSSSRGGDRARVWRV